MILKSRHTSLGLRPSLVFLELFHKNVKKIPSVKLLARARETEERSDEVSRFKKVNIQLLKSRELLLFQ